MRSGRTPGETYPLVDTLSTRSKKYSSNPSKHQLEWTFYLNYLSMIVYMILIKRNISTNQSYISFYIYNGHTKLWMTNTESLDLIRQKCVVFSYIRNQNQSIQQSYYSILKILSTITSISLPINTTLRIEERWKEKKVHRKMSRESRNEKSKAFVQKHTELKKVHPLQYTKY